MAKIKKIKKSNEELDLLRKERLMEYGMYSLIGVTGLLIVELAHLFDVGKAHMLVENITNEMMAKASGITGLGLSGASIAGFVSSRFINKKRRERINELKIESMPYELCSCNETEEDIIKNR